MRRGPAPLSHHKQPGCDLKLTTEQDVDALGGGLLGALLDLLVGESAERMLDHDGVKIVHAERVALHLRLVQELRSDDNCRGAAGGFQSDAVMRTARRARPSIADCGHHDVVSAAMVAISVGSASLEKLSLR